ncbi:hypothetical protein PIROE2DRAFT_15081 [Piromyces sp. E2]|nr:hypothetical protein PIROE2DRAFT_15081 [Piromyces sp. E2]|eukprot:OUM59389.1 hypothetical protein PIROE2DRAFT_15081 [Piromyces sp. E2]
MNHLLFVMIACFSYIILGNGSSKYDKEFHFPQKGNPLHNYVTDNKGKEYDFCINNSNGGKRYTGIQENLRDCSIKNEFIDCYFILRNKRVFRFTKTTEKIVECYIPDITTCDIYDDEVNKIEKVAFYKDNKFKNVLLSSSYSTLSEIYHKYYYENSKINIKYNKNGELNECTTKIEYCTIYTNE